MIGKWRLTNGENESVGSRLSVFFRLPRPAQCLKENRGLDSHIWNSSFGELKHTGGVDKRSLRGNKAFRNAALRYGGYLNRLWRRKKLQGKKLPGVVPEYSLPRIAVEALPASFENELGVGPGACRMGIIRSEHDFVGIENVTDHLDA